MTESSCLALVLLRQKESANFVNIYNLWSYWIIESDNLDEKKVITWWSVTWCNHSGVCCYKVIPDMHINTRMCLAEQCQRMKKMDQKLKRACMYIRFLQLVNWDGLLHSLTLGLGHKKNAIVSNYLLCIKSGQHGLLDFCWTNRHIISHAATRCWMLDRCCYFSCCTFKGNWLFKVSLCLSLSCNLFCSCL